MGNMLRALNLLVLLVLITTSNIIIFAKNYCSRSSKNWNVTLFDWPIDFIVDRLIVIKYIDSGDFRFTFIYISIWLASIQV